MSNEAPSFIWWDGVSMMPSPVDPRLGGYVRYIRWDIADELRAENEQLRRDVKKAFNDGYTCCMSDLVDCKHCGKRALEVEP